mgnify:CR=1 FL=1
MKLFQKDMDDEQYWLSFWSIAGVILCLVVSMICYIEYQEDLMIHDLINGGADPIALACVYAPGNTNEASCLIQAQNQIKR